MLPDCYDCQSISCRPSIGAWNTVMAKAYEIAGSLTFSPPVMGYRKASPFLVKWSRPQSYRGCFYGQETIVTLWHDLFNPLKKSIASCSVCFCPWQASRDKSRRKLIDLSKEPSSRTPEACTACRSAQSLPFPARQFTTGERRRPLPTKLPAERFGRIRIPAMELSEMSQIAAVFQCAGSRDSVISRGAVYVRPSSGIGSPNRP